MESSGEEEEPPTSPKEDPPSDRNEKPMPSLQSYAIPNCYRAGKHNNLDILERIFPNQRKSVLELVLQGVDGDLIKAIEHFFSAQDTLTPHSSQRTPPVPGRYHPYSDIHKTTPGTSPAVYSLGDRNARSAFTPLGLPVPFPGISGLHTAFVPQASALRTSLGDRFYDKSAITKAYSELCQVPFPTSGVSLSKFPMYPYGIYGNLNAWDVYSDLKLNQTSPLKLQTDDKSPE